MCGTLSEHRLTLMAHTLGSIGQLVKKNKVTIDDRPEATIAEIQRIYEGYVRELKDIKEYILPKD